MSEKADPEVSGKFDIEPDQLNHHVSRYADYNNAFRTWMLWFGVAAPVFISSMSDLFTKLQAQGDLVWVLSLFGVNGNWGRTAINYQASENLGLTLIICPNPITARG